MKNKHIVPLINAYSAIQKENIFIIGCAKNIVLLKKAFEENNKVISTLQNKDSEDKWLYIKPEGKQEVMINELIPFKDEQGNFVKSYEGVKLEDNQVEYTVEPSELKNVLDALIKLDDDTLTVILHEFKLEDLEAKEKQGWKPNNPNFMDYFNLLVELELFK